MKASLMPLSICGVPVAGLAGLFVCLWHPQISLQNQAFPSDVIYLVKPDPKLDKSMTIFLRQEARNVAFSRTHDGPAMQAKATANYNLIAQECTPGVFKATHLPPALVL